MYFPWYFQIKDPAGVEQGNLRGLAWVSEIRNLWILPSCFSVSKNKIFSEAFWGLHLHAQVVHLLQLSHVLQGGCVCQGRGKRTEEQAVLSSRTSFRTTHGFQLKGAVSSNLLQNPHREMRGKARTVRQPRNTSAVTGDTGTEFSANGSYSNIHSS